MTETDWLTGTDPKLMLESLRVSASERKLRLFAVACCWDHEHPLWEGPASSRAVTVAERFADGKATDEDLAVAGERVFDQIRHNIYGDEPVWDPTWWTCAPNIREGVFGCVFYSGNRGAGVPFDSMDYDTITVEWNAAESVFQCTLLRCIFGNPFRPVTFSPAWRSETTVALAIGIYADRAFDRLPILADALEEAGCADPDVLTHCRGDGPHARGCWVVDDVLGN